MKPDPILRAACIWLVIALAAWTFPRSSLAHYVRHTKDLVLCERGTKVLHSHGPPVRPG